MDKSRINILVVDDERGLCAGIQEALQREGYVVDAVNDAPTALKLIGERLYNLVVTDMKMPAMSGLQLLKEAKQKSRDTQFILMTAYGTVESAVEAMKEGAYDYLSKPLDMQRLRALVLKALEFQALVAENNELRLRLQKRSEPSLLVGESEAMRKVTELSDEVARSEVTVLIEGESGTGKEIVARSIHLKSARADKPFISVNCAALPEQLLEAELFGHVKGAFTGAVADKPGRFQLADGGTLFLDEIGDLSPKGQGDLLRVLEDGTFRMVGGTKMIRVNVRVVAATSRWAPRSSCRWTCAWWRRRTKNVRKWSSRESFAKTCCIACKLFPSPSRRCVSGPRTFRCSSNRSSNTSRASTNGGAKNCLPQPFSFASGFPGRATCGNCAT